MPAQDKPLKRGWILAALMVTMTLAAMDNTIVSTAIPQIVGDLGGFSMFSWVFSIYLLIQTVTIPIYGKMADVYGRKPVLVIGTLIFLIGSALCALSWNMLTLIIFRGVQALGAGAVMATVNTLAGDIYTVEERARIQGWLSSVWGMSAIIGPALGGFFAEYLSWHWIFLINLPIGAVAILLILGFLHEKRVQIKHKIDFPSAGLMFLAGTTLMFCILEGGNSWPWLSFPGLAMPALTIVLILLTVKRERRSPEPIMPAWIWKSKVLTGANLSMIFMGLIMMVPNMYLPVFGQAVTGMAPIAAGFILASMSITWPLSSGLSGRLYLKIGFRNCALTGICIVMGGIALFLFMPFPGNAVQLVGSQLLLGAGFGLMSTPMLVGVQSIVEWNRRGVVTGANMFSRYFGQTLGAAVFGSVFNSVMTGQLQEAPQALRGNLPKVNRVIESLQAPGLSSAVRAFLRTTFYHSTMAVYAGLLLCAVICLAILIRMPARFEKMEEV